MEKGDQLQPKSFQDLQSPSYIYFTDIHLDLDGINQQIYSYGLCNVITGKKTIIGSKCKGLVLNFTLSPNQNYLIYYKSATRQYYAYDLSSSQEICITKSTNTPMLDRAFSDYPNPEYAPSEIVGWMDHGDKILLSDSYDIWSINLKNPEKFKNLTNGYGRKNNVQFYPIEKKSTNKYSIVQVFREHETAILKAFNLQNKEYGYYSLSLKETPILTKLSMDAVATHGSNYRFNILSESDFFESQIGKGYLVRREKCNDAPNYFYSKDLKTFQRLSNIQPQLQYNWLVSELHTYSDSSGHSYQGVLYKPENFDSTKKYPIIFNYYQTHSSQLNSFPSVQLGGGDMDIPYLVSHDYLIFRPDIYAEPGKMGEGVLKSINSALDHLNHYQWIDLNKVAMTGASLGGWETNYFITHTDKPIAAAISGSGNSDLVAYSFSLARNGNDRFGYSQFGPLKMSALFSEQPEIYLQNSPLYSAQNIKSPILLMHNPEDKQTEIYQSITFFNQLRRLGKPVWLISYKGEDHALAKPENIIDYKKRALEFLDHFLKGAPEPGWMKQCITSKD